MMNKNILVLLSILVGLLSYSNLLAADKNEATLYLWASDIKGSASVGPVNRPIAIDFKDLLDKTEAAFMGRYERRVDRWGGAFDITYLKLSDQQMGFDTEVKTSIVELLAAYHTSETFNIIGGIRGTSMDISVRTPAGTSGGGDEDLIDGFIGARARFPFADKWSLRLRGDIGAGTSDFVWNAIVGLDWRFAKKWSAKLAYRWLDYDIKGEGPANASLTTDMRFEGPGLAVSFYW